MAEVRRKEETLRAYSKALRGQRCAPGGDSPGKVEPNEAASSAYIFSTGGRGACDRSHGRGCCLIPAR